MDYILIVFGIICGDSGLLVKWNTKQSLFVGVKENSINNSSKKIYPNPAKDFLNIDVDILNDNNAKLQILNSLGQIIREEEMYFENGKSKINVRQLTSGIYTARFTGEINYSLKFIK